MNKAISSRKKYVQYMVAYFCPHMSNDYVRSLCWIFMLTCPLFMWTSQTNIITPSSKILFLSHDNATNCHLLVSLIPYKSKIFFDMST